MTNTNLSPVQAFHKLLKDLPDFGMKHWKWETPFREDPEKAKLLDFNPDGFRKLRNQASTFRRKNIGLMLFPATLALLFFILELVFLNKIVQFSLEVIIGIVAACMAPITYCSTQLCGRTKYIDREKIPQLLNKQLSENQIADLNHYTKPKIATFAALSIFLIVWLLAIAFPFYIYYTAGTS